MGLVACHPVVGAREGRVVSPSEKLGEALLRRSARQPSLPQLAGREPGENDHFIHVSMTELVCPECLGEHPCGSVRLGSPNEAGLIDSQPYVAELREDVVVREGGHLPRCP